MRNRCMQNANYHTHKSQTRNPSSYHKGLLNCMQNMNHTERLPCFNGCKTCTQWLLVMLATVIAAPLTRISLVTAASRRCSTSISRLIFSISLRVCCCLEISWRCLTDRVSSATRCEKSSGLSAKPLKEASVSRGEVFLLLLVALSRDRGASSLFLQGYCSDFTGVMFKVRQVESIGGLRQQLVP